MGFLTRMRMRHEASTVRVVCPLCHGDHVALGAIDLVYRTVRHSCDDCGHRWTEAEIDLVGAEVVAHARAEAARALRR